MKYMVIWMGRTKKEQLEKEFNNIYNKLNSAYISLITLHSLSLQEQFREYAQDVHNINKIIRREKKRIVK